MHTIAERKLLMLRPNDILPSKIQTRRHFDDYELQRLADSIATSGVVQPISVRRNADGDYELIAGERRLRAARLAGLRRVPCILHKVDDTTAAFYAVIENLQRSDLTIFEEAESIRMLIEQYNLTRTETAVRLGLAQSTLSNKLRLLQLSPELQEKITGAHLTERHARALLRLPPEKRGDALNRIIAEGMTLRQSEELIESVLNPAPTQEPEQAPVRKMAIGDIRIFANSLFKLVDTMQNAGIDARTQKNENDKYIEYKVRISKVSLQTGYQQLKIC